jgi:hypothetical protein
MLGSNYAPLTCLWLGSILAFAEAAIPAEKATDRRSPWWGWAVCFGILAGAAAGTKLTGWPLPLPFFIWTVHYRERKGALTLAVGVIVASATVYAITPPWWFSPWQGLTAFFRSNLTRGVTTPIPVQFLGTVYLSPGQSLPWYNTLVWTVAASPVGFLAWALAGSIRAVRHRGDRFASLAVICWVFPLVLRALPHTPGHDGVRQILPAFGALALVAGLGVSARVNHDGKRGIGQSSSKSASAASSRLAWAPVASAPITAGLEGAIGAGAEPLPPSSLAVAPR